MLFPELERLYGVPQPPRHHPEVDTGVHTFMVLDQAERLSGDPVVRFAALTHDLGKGNTPRDILPSHHGHEQRGVVLIDQLCDRYRIPNRYRELARLVAGYHGHMHRVFELRPDTLAKTLEGLDAYRRPERVEGILLACEADYRGRTGFEERPYPQADYVRRAHARCLDIQARELVAQGLKGQAITQALRRLRIAALTELKQAHEAQAAGDP